MSSCHVRLKLRPLSAALLAALGAPVGAEEPPPAAGANVLPEVQVRGQGERGGYNAGVTTVGKTPAETRDVPQTVTVINREVMQAQGVTTLTDALRNVPGITLSSGEGAVIGDNINLRGFSARTDTYLDGLRDRGQYVRDTFNLESIEVLKGPSSALFGRGSTGGVINQVSKRPLRDPVTEAGVGIGTDAYYRATADVGRPLGEAGAFRIAAFAQTNESTRDVVEADRYGIAPALRLGIGTPTEVTVSALAQRGREIPDYGIPVVTTGTAENPGKPVALPASRFFGFTDDTFDQDVYVLTARVEHKISPAVSLRNQTQYGDADLTASPTVFTGTVTPSSTSVARTRRDRTRNDSWLINQTDVVSTFDLGAVKHTLITGVELARDWFENQAYNWTGVPNADLQNPVYQPMPSSAMRAPGNYTESTADTFAIHANDQLDLGKTWKLVGGLRFDRFATDFLTREPSGAETPLARTDKMTSYRLGVLYQPDEMQSYYISHGTSFNPSAEAATLTGSSATATSANGTVALDPEENRAYEVGAKWSLAGGDLGLNAALFRVDKLNARTTDPVTRLTTLDGNIRVDGIELGASGRLTPRWQIFTGYTFLDAEIVQAREVGAQGKRPQNTPEHSASLWATYSPAPAWEAGAGVAYSSQRFTNNTNTAAVDGYTRYDATVAYKHKRYDLRLNLLNVTDEEYFDVASSARATPARGRAAILTLSYRR